MAKAGGWRFLLWAVNVLIFLATLLLLIATALVFFRNDDLVQLFGEDQFRPVAIIYMMVGGVIVLVTFLGCLGAFSGNVFVLAVYVVLMICLIMAQIGGAFVGVHYYNEIEDQTEKLMTDSMKQYDDKEAVEDAWDRFQTEGKCCGLNKSSDWHLVAGRAIPPSCCEVYDDTNAVCINDEYFTTGCMAKAQEALEDNLEKLMAAGFGIAGFEFLMVLIAMFAICGLRKATTYA
jgi:amino acid transporter